MQTPYDLVYLAAQRAPDRVAIVDDLSERQLTYGALLQRIDEMAAGFQAAGIKPGQCVATCLPNVFEHGLALLALTRLGAIPALINARLKQEDVVELIKQGAMQAAILPADTAMIDAARSVLPNDAPLFVHGGTVVGTRDLAACHGSPVELSPYRRPNGEETAFIFHTSGTTGLPKGVEIPHRATDARMLYMAVQCGMTHGPQNRILGLMPLFHVVGFYSVYLGILGLDGTYYNVSAFNPAAAVEAIVEHDIRILYATPTHFHALLEAENFAPKKMAGISHVIYAGAAMPGPLLDRVSAAFGAKIINIYGTTEVMNALYMPDPQGRPHLYRPGFYSNVRVGRFGSDVHDEAAVGDDGELLVDATADATFSRYLLRPEATREKLTDGWYRTGDIAIKRPDGDLEVKGRVDDMIISGGENIFPEEVEAALTSHEGVDACGVVGLPDERWGEIVVACVVANGPQPEERALDAHIRAGSLADFKRPRAYVFVDSLPMNATGKVLRRILRDTALHKMQR